VRCARAEVRRCGSDDDRVCGLRELDVIERVPLGNERRMHRAPRERLEGERCYELGGGPCHDDIHERALLREEAREPSRFVAGDAARDAQQDAAAFERSHDGAAVSGRAGARRGI